jgi:hypothetical protein
VSEIINLRQVRKQKARTRRETQSAANRALFGRSKTERAIEMAHAEKLRSTLDGAKQEPPTDS